MTCGDDSCFREPEDPNQFGVLTEGLVLTGTAFTATEAGVSSDGFGGVVVTIGSEATGEFSLNLPGVPLTTSFSDADTSKAVTIDKGVPASDSEIAIEEISRITATLEETLTIFSPDLNYTIFFVYDNFDPMADASVIAMGALGFDTPVGDMPTTGTATYTGKTFGIVANLDPAVDTAVRLEGDLSLTANFGTSSLDGTITNTFVATIEDPDSFEFTTPLNTPVAWNNLDLAATFNNGNRFSGTVTTTNTVGGFFGLPSGVTGPLEGQFFGPGAAEVGGFWSIETLSTGGDIISGGSFGGHQ